MYFKGYSLHWKLEIRSRLQFLYLLGNPLWFFCPWVKSILALDLVEWLLLFLMGSFCRLKIKIQCVCHLYVVNLLSFLKCYEVWRKILLVGYWSSTKSDSICWLFFDVDKWIFRYNLFHVVDWNFFVSDLVFIGSCVSICWVFYWS